MKQSLLSGSASSFGRAAMSGGHSKAEPESSTVSDD